MIAATTPSASRASEGSVKSSFNRKFPRFALSHHPGSALFAQRFVEAVGTYVTGHCSLVSTGAFTNPGSRAKPQFMG
jgi:hypothetical protein